MGTVRQSGLLYAQHRSCVYTDNDFICSADDLRQKIGSTKLGIAIDNGEEYLSQSGIKLSKRLEDEAYKLSRRYALEISDLALFLNNVPIDNVKATTAVSMDINGIYIRIEPHTTISDVQSIWPMVEAMKSIAHESYRPTKKKLPENPRLIYAVFKSRLKGLTYREVFNLYQQQKLPGYNGIPSQFKDEESLERYYQKYKPTI